MIQLHAIISGHVQGVAYRAYVQDAAGVLGVTGYVKNLADGTVEVVADGMADTLKEFVEYLHEGSLLSCVDAVAVEWHSIKRGYDEFSILY
jgi:acylphosphatase